MANLFSLPTPAEVRQKSRRQLLGQINAQGFGGMNAPMNRAFANIGGLLGAAVGGPGAAEQKAQSVQDILQKTTATFGEFDPNDMGKVGQLGKQLVANLMQGGQQDAAFTVAAKLKTLQPEEDATIKDVQQKQINTLRSGIEKVTKDMKIIDSAYTKIGKNVKEGTASGDMGVVFGIMKLFDPNSTVREGEYATAKNAAGVPERLINLYNNTKDGQLLSPAQRTKFMATADNLYQAQRESTDRSIEQQLEFADADKIDRGRVLGTNRLKSYKKRQSGMKTKKPTVIKVDW